MTAAMAEAVVVVKEVQELPFVLTASMNAMAMIPISAAILETIGCGCFPKAVLMIAMILQENALRIQVEEIVEAIQETALYQNVHPVNTNVQETILTTQRKADTQLENGEVVKSLLLNYQELASFFPNMSLKN